MKIVNAFRTFVARLSWRCCPSIWCLLDNALVCKSGWICDRHDAHITGDALPRRCLGCRARRHWFFGICLGDL